MKEVLFEVVDFVSTTRPMGQKRCGGTARPPKRTESCRKATFFVIIQMLFVERW